MKIRGSLMGMGLLLMGAGLAPAVADTFRPEPGVRCDDVAQICHDRGSPNVELTRQYFGRDAARALRWELRREDRTRHGYAFYPEPGVRCDRAEQVCYNRRGEPSFRLTRDYLGFGAARRLAWRSDSDWGYSTQ
ncbi:MAG: YcgJ family protein [Candidatus Competibacteraceae bacterium]